VTLDVLDPDRIARPETPLSALRRRLSGRYPVDPFGLDPQLADLCAPLFTAAVRVRVAGGENVPTTGAAVIVSNRGFGIAEPAALGVAVHRASGRRLRVVGAPDLPFVGTATRRLGAISSSGPDVASALRAGHLVGIPLAPTWLRTGAGDAPVAVARALTLTPIVPAAVRAVASAVSSGPGRSPSGPWSRSPIPTTPMIRSRRRASPRRCDARSAPCSTRSRRSHS